MIAIPNKYHVLDQDYRYIGHVIAQKSLEQAMQKAKALILSKRSLSCPHPVLVPDRKFVEFGNAVFSGPFSEANVSTAELQHSSSPKTINRGGKNGRQDGIRKPVRVQSIAVDGSKARGKQMGQSASQR